MLTFDAKGQTAGTFLTSGDVATGSPDGSRCSGESRDSIVSVRDDAPEEITRCFEILSEGGTIRTSLGPAPLGSALSGILDDHFGTTGVMDVATTGS